MGDNTLDNLSKEYSLHKLADDTPSKPRKRLKVAAKPSTDEAPELK